jgi:hypothetical protein
MCYCFNKKLIFLDIQWISEKIIFYIKAIISCHIVLYWEQSWFQFSLWWYTWVEFQVLSGIKINSLDRVYLQRSWKILRSTNSLILSDHWTKMEGINDSCWSLTRHRQLRKIICIEINSEIEKKWVIFKSDIISWWYYTKSINLTSGLKKNGNVF